MSKMNIPKTLLFFGIPGVIIFYFFNYSLPLFLEDGMSLHWAVYISIWLPICLLSIFVIFIWKRSNKSLNDYFWVSRLSVKKLLLVFAIFICVQIAEGLLSFTRPALASLPFFNVPDHYPDFFKADFEFKLPFMVFMGLPVKGNYFFIFYWFLWLIPNILGEEFLWRAYALPRMEKYFGRWAWLINGLLWNISIHYYMRWSFITLLPTSLMVPYFSQKYKSWIPGIIIHGLGNVIFFIIIIVSVI